MRQVLSRVFAVCVAAAGLILAVPYAVAGPAPEPCPNPAAPVPATDYYNLTGQNCNGTDTPGLNISAEIQGTSTIVGVGALFNGGPSAVTVGTGVLQPFVRIQNDGGEKKTDCGDPCIESGYNTNASGQFETKDTGEHNWTHAINLSDVGTETIDGVVYRTFILDINEANNKDDRYLSLDKFQVYLSSSATLNSFCETIPDGTSPACAFNQGFGPDNPLVYSMDAVGDDATVGLNYNLNHGSGKGVDLFVRVPDALFTAAIPNVVGGDSNPFVYLYSSFGATGVLTKDSAPCGPSQFDQNGAPPTGCPAGYLPPGNYGQNAGFEEWSSLKGVPEPMSVALLLVGLAAIGFMRRQQPSPIAC